MLVNLLCVVCASAEGQAQRVRVSASDARLQEAGPADAPAQPAQAAARHVPEAGRPAGDRQRAGRTRRQPAAAARRRTRLAQETGETGHGTGQRSSTIRYSVPGQREKGRVQNKLGTI